MRKYYLDNIRYFTIIMVVLYHLIYMYNGQTKPGALGPFSKNQIQDVFQYITFPWMMTILFIISGISSNFYLKISNNFISDRTNKLLVPSIFGLFIYGWAQGYINILLYGSISTIPTNLNKFAIYLIYCISGTGVLWFNHLLWIYSILLVLIIKFEKNTIHNLFKNINFIIILLLGFGLWLSAKFLNTPTLIYYRVGIYCYSYLIGYFIFSHETNIKYIESNYILFSILSFIFGFLYISKFYGEDYTSKEIFGNILSILYSWFTSLSIFGIAKKFFDREFIFTKFMKDKSYGIYIFHYLILTSTAYYLYNYTKLGPIFQYILVLCSSLIGSILLFEIISKIPFINWLVLGITNKKINKIKKLS